MRDAVLYLLFRADAPGEPPSRHRLAGIDSVTITVGPRAAHRRGNALSLQITDPRLATSPAVIRQRYDAWTVDSPVTVAASPGSDPGGARLVSRVAGGDVFLAGNTVMSIEREELPDTAADDTLADDVASPLPGLGALAPAHLGARIARILALSHPTPSTLHPLAALALHRYRWPAHERELRRVVQRAACLAAGSPVGIEHLPDEIAQLGCEARVLVRTDDLDDRSAARREELTTLLLEHRGRVRDVATAVGKNREQIYRWSVLLGIDLQSFRR